MAEEKKSSSESKKSIQFSVGVPQLLYTLLLIAVFLIGYLAASVKYLGQMKNQVPPPVLGANTAAPSPTPGKYNVSTGHFPIKGDSNAKITLVEFADFRCPFCEKVFSDTEPQIIKDYVDTGKVKMAFRQFAFLGPASTTAANAAECANDQNKFWEFHDYMYKNQPAESDTSLFNTDGLTNIAQNLGMDATAFRTCLDSNKDAQKASADMADGQKVGVSGTPTFFVNGIQLVGAQPYSAFKTLIDQELAKAK